MYHYDHRDFDEYRERMRGVRQFKELGIDPRWAPGTGDIFGFCHDEVVRQWHDTTIRSSGGIRVDRMVAAWEYAKDKADSGTPTTQDILALGYMVEPDHNSIIGFRTGHVGFGLFGTESPGAPPRLIGEMVAILVAKAPDVAPILGNPGLGAAEYRATWIAYEWNSALREFASLVDSIKTADDWYLAYEAVHPFADGNGRTGKILHNWLLGSLNEPVLVDNYFGKGKIG